MPAYQQLQTPRTQDVGLFRRVTRWRTSDQKLRWCTSALGATERQFRRVKGHRQLPLFKQALHATLSVTHSTAA